MRIALLGLGNMGARMACNLVEAGHEVCGFDLVPQLRERSAADGIRIAASGPEAVRDAEAVITMFPAGRHVLEAYRGTESTEGLLSAASTGTLFVDSSTISVDEAREAAELARAAGHRPLDAPVSGGTAGAEAGTLTFMVGGSEADVAAVRPLFEAMGRTIVHCGGSGNGQAAKVCNNMLLAVTTIGAAEAFLLGEKLGLTDQALFEVMSTSAAQCWSVTTNCPVPGPVPTSPASNDYRPGFAAALMAKDLGLAEAAMESAGVRAGFGAAAQKIYQEMIEAGRGDLDFSAVYRTISQESA